MNKIIEKKPMQMYGIDDFISEMKLPMPYVDIMARIHYLTGYNKSALILLHQHAEWIVPDGKASQYYLDWIKPLPKKIPKDQEERMKSIGLLDWQYIFYMEAMDALINGRAIQGVFLDDHWRMVRVDQKSDLHSHRVNALISYYSGKKPDAKSNSPLMRNYRNVLKSSYRCGDGIAKNDRSRYVRDHEACGVILYKIGSEKALSYWKDERAMIKRNPKFMDLYSDD